MSEYQGCDNCKYAYKTSSELPCIECTHNATDHYKPMTNADRIRNMTDEELADFFRHYISCAFCDVRTDTCGDDDCKDLMLKWLQAEVKEGEQMSRCCGNCEWNRQTYDRHCNVEFYCGNEESEMYGVPTMYNDSCEEYMERD